MKKFRLIIDIDLNKLGKYEINSLKKDLNSQTRGQYIEANTLEGGETFFGKLLDRILISIGTNKEIKKSLKITKNPWFTSMFLDNSINVNIKEIKI